ncbi:MAG: GNAT family N-acetyltransferase [Acetobacteraceae bacterium]|nr:GNAT family N-acetyltransferase [Acetobacteraceae bacterium]
MRQADAAAVAALIRAAFGMKSVATHPPPSAVQETDENVLAELATGGGACAVVGDRVVGSLLWHREPRGLYIGRLSVAREARNVGVAQGLIAAAEIACRSISLARLLLSTRLVLSDNRRLFARCGFVENREYAHMGYPHPTAVDMEKSVS